MVPYIKTNPEIRSALSKGLPVVALESTIISHGMPWPRNVETALAVEQIIRDMGCVPATIAIMDGECRVGLNEDEIIKFGQEKNIWKVSLRDLAYVLTRHLPGATTVAATMRIAAMSGIRVFVTGGIGGVHRGAEKTMDISADLTEMAKTSVAVVSAGIKSILDIGMTLEFLETLGVPVVTYGQDEFPSFYSSKSGHLSPLRMDSVGEIARMIQIKWKMGLEGGLLVANPVPAEFQVPTEKIENFIRNALDRANDLNIKGKDITPFLLQNIAENTRGESLEANISLIKHNAKTGAALAKAFTELGGSY